MTSMDALARRFLEQGPDEPIIFEPYAEPGLLEELQSLLGINLPLSFRSLYGNFTFPGFDAGPLWMLGTPAYAEPEESVLTLKRDPALFEILRRHGFCPAARHSSGDYDPVCFDLNRRSRNGEFPLVRVDHEEALLVERAKVVEEIAPSLRAFMESRTKK